MRVLIVSEGKHELGDEGVTGALETLVRRVIDGPCDCDVRRVKDRVLHGSVHGKGGGLFKKAIRWVLYANQNGYDGIVLVIDQDGDPQREQQLADAQAHLKLTPLPRALGVAIMTFDAWMLADESALSAVLGHHVDRQPDPETMRDAKGTCNRLRDQSESTVGLTHLYSEIANKVDLSTLAERCPRGFGPFAERLRQMARGIA